MLTKDKWHYVSAMMSQPYTAFWDSVTYYDSFDILYCIKDNYVKYNNDNSCEYDDGTIRCEPIDQPKTITGSWELKSEDGKLFLYESIHNVDINQKEWLEVISLTDQEMVLYLAPAYLFEDTILRSVTFRFKHQ